MAVAENRPAIPALTTLRFFAAFYVLVFHSLEGTTSIRAFASFISTGYVAVDFFFVLSGFVLTYKYCGRDGSLLSTPKQFWAARCARVYPIYAVSLVIGAPLYLRAVHAHGHANLVLLVGSAVAAFFLLQSWVYRIAGAWNAPAWSLSVEAFLYFVFPFAVPSLLRRVGKHRLFGAAFALWLAALAIPMLYVLTNPDGLAHVDSHSDGRYLLIINYLPLLHVPAFLIGALAGWWYLQSKSPVPRGLTAFAVLALGVALCAGDWLPSPMLHNGLLAPLFAVVICGTASADGIVARCLGHRTFVLLGDASYALYLLHYPILGYYRWVFGQHRSAIAMLPLFIFIQLISIMAFKLVEVPARQRLRTMLASATSSSMHVR
jgi:peptidoglycan/LPS O-acetylase OafA/YrhL